MTFRGDDLTIPATPDTSQAPQHGFPGSHPYTCVGLRCSRNVKQPGGSGSGCLTNGVHLSVAGAKAGIGSWLGFYNEERQHQSHPARSRASDGRPAGGGQVDAGCAASRNSTATRTR